MQPLRFTEYSTLVAACTRGLTPSLLGEHETSQKCARDIDPYKPPHSRKLMRIYASFGNTSSLVPWIAVVFGVIISTFVDK